MNRLPFSLLMAIPAIVGPSSGAQDQTEGLRLRRIEDCRMVITHAIRLAKQGDLERLLSASRTAKSPLSRVVYGYALFVLDRKRNPTYFLEAFPKKELKNLDLSSLDNAFSEEEAPAFLGETKPFSYWSINEALLSLARSGNSKALRIWLTYAGGGAEHIEGRIWDLSKFFSSSPRMVIKNWDLFRDCVDELYVCEESPEHFRKLRKRYLQLLPPGHSARIEILAQIDRLEAEAVQESKGSQGSQDTSNSFLGQQNTTIALTLRSTRTPPALSSALSQPLDSSAPFSASV